MIIGGKRNEKAFIRFDGSRHVLRGVLRRVGSDGAVTIIDALIVLRYAMGSTTDIDTNVADVSRNGVVDSIDALLILRHAMGLI